MEKTFNEPILKLNDNKVLVHNNVNVLFDINDSSNGVEHEIEIGNLNDYLEVYCGMEDI